MVAKQIVFITGASSPMMKELISKIPKSKYKIWGLSRSFNHLDKSINWLHGDLLDSETYKEVALTADIIIHAAGITHTKKSDEYRQVNHRGTVSLIDVLEKRSKVYFILISSRTAGLDSGAYGESKLLAEQELRFHSDNWLILRPAEVFGGDKSEGIDRVIQSSSQGGLQLCPIGMNSLMYPIYVKDLSELMYEEIFVKKTRNEIITLSGNDGYSFVGLVRLIEKVTGRKTLILPIPRVVLKIFAKMTSFIPWDIPGFVPDQVARLYCYKEQGNASKDLLTLEQYLKSQMA